MREVFIAADHRGFKEKGRIMGKAEFFKGQGLELVDLGAYEYHADDDFNDAAITVARAVLRHPDSIGVLICGTGAGMAIQANRFKGVRAVCAYSIEIAELARKHNNANILCLSADMMTPATIDQVMLTFLNTDFLGDEKYARRNARLDDVSNLTTQEA